MLPGWADGIHVPLSLDGHDVNRSGVEELHPTDSHMHLLLTHSFGSIYLARSRSFFIAVFDRLSPFQLFAAYYTIGSILGVLGIDIGVQHWDGYRI